MGFTRKKMRFGDVLVKEGLLSDEELLQALEEQKKTKMKLGEYLVSEGVVSEEDIVKVLQTQSGIKYIPLRGQRMTPELMNLVSVSVLRKHNVVPLEINKAKNELVLAMSNPFDLLAQDDIGIITNYRVSPRISTTREIDSMLDRHYGNDTAMQAAEQYAQEREQKIALMQQDEPEVQENDNSNAPIVALVRSVLEQAVRSRCSDIHFDAAEKHIRLRYRIDGDLVEQMEYDISLMPALSTRIKIMGGMDIAEKRKPQDGRISFTLDRQDYDVRVSMLPSYYGEKIVMRVANSSMLTKPKGDLGLRDHEMEQFDRIISRPNGIMLVTGPTGSGKSTTLYTALSELNKPEVNIITVEDPVEANIPGLNQVHVNPKAGLTFAAALKSILRQDPDIIMIGEIRDEETARIAVQASITGHLVVSTLHTNSACATVSRLADMGLETYLLADAIVGVIAQRLVRRLCDKCKREKRASSEDLMALGMEPGERLTVCVPVGCDYCSNTGFAGRMGVYEIMEVNHELKRHIASGSTSEEMQAVAEKNGMRTLRTGVIAAVKEKITAVSEVQRLTAGGH
ncbi:MAG: ATPase, T2SS/T4P/T4SS family [Eubacteriales bacterium]